LNCLQPLPFSFLSVMNKIHKTILKWLLLIVGSIFVGLGIIGIFVPILPTTPFLLLAAACFLRSSNKMYHWLLTNRLFGKYFKSYIEGNGISINVKIITISFLWITIIYSAIFFIDGIIIRLILLLIAISVTSHIMLIKNSH